MKEEERMLVCFKIPRSDTNEVGENEVTELQSYTRRNIGLHSKTIAEEI